MKKFLCLLVLSALMVCIIGMRKEQVDIPVVPSPSPVVAITPEPTPEPTEYLFEGYTAQQIADFFCEVALGEEYTQGDGGSNAVQKWLQPIYYTVYGQPGQEDEQVLTSFIEELNCVEGFPGMFPAQEPWQENCSIRFLDRQEMENQAGHVVNGEYVDGISQWYYYTDSNELHTMNIWICTETSQSVRNSVILEEIVNSIGLGKDTIVRSDSIIYQGYSETQQLSAVDWEILRILYSEEIRCGMTEEQCREAINEMYK